MKIYRTRFFLILYILLLPSILMAAENGTYNPIIYTLPDWGISFQELADYVEEMNVPYLKKDECWPNLYYISREDRLRAAEGKMETAPFASDITEFENYIITLQKIFGNDGTVLADLQQCYLIHGRNSGFGVFLAKYTFYTQEAVGYFLNLHVNGFVSEYGQPKMASRSDTKFDYRWTFGENSLTPLAMLYSELHENGTITLVAVYCNPWDVSAGIHLTGPFGAFPTPCLYIPFVELWETAEAAHRVP